MEVPTDLVPVSTLAPPTAPPPAPVPPVPPVPGLGQDQDQNQTATSQPVLLDKPPTDLVPVRLSQPPSDLVPVQAQTTEPTLAERFYQNARAGFGGTLAGAAVNYFRNPDTVMQERQQTEQMTPWYDEPGITGKALAGGTALAGSIAGSLLSPESYIPLGKGYQAVRAGAPVLREVAKDALIGAGVMGASNVGAQGINIAGGNQPEGFDPSAAATQAGVGATFGLAGPVLGKIVNAFRGPKIAPEVAAAAAPPRTPLQIMEQDGVDAFTAGERARAEGWQAPSLPSPPDDLRPVEPQPASTAAPAPAEPPQAGTAPPEPVQPPSQSAAPAPSVGPESARASPAETGPETAAAAPKGPAPPEPLPPASPQIARPSEPAQPLTPEPVAPSTPPVQGRPEGDRTPTPGPEQPQGVPGVGTQDTGRVQPQGVQGDTGRGPGPVDREGAVPVSPEGGPPAARPPDAAQEGAAVPQTDIGRTAPPGEAPGVGKPEEPGAKPPAEQTIAAPRGNLYRAAVSELDRRNAPDSEYRGLLSTGGKDPLKPGETWRGRVLDYARQADQAGEVLSTAPRPEDVSSASQARPGEPSSKPAEVLSAAPRPEDVPSAPQDTAPAPQDTGTPSQDTGTPTHEFAGQTVYRGEGRPDQASVYGPMSAGVPIAGEGRYSAFDRAAAEQFGPRVSEHPVDLKNPLIIRSDQDWRTLTREAGWQVPNPSGLSKDEVTAMTKQLKAVVQAKGHDGLIVHWDDKTPYDVDAQGRPIKLLRHVFDTPQVVDYRPQERAAPALQERAPAAGGELAKREPPVNITSEQRQTYAALHDTGTSPYRQVFRDAGLDPDAAVQLPIQRQAELVKNQVQATYGLKNVTSDLSHIDTRDRLSTFYQNAQAMAHVQGMPPEGIGLGGRLSLHLANDTGKGYLGAYHPGQRSITLVGGANSFAHEWMHAADHFLNEALAGNPKARGLLSETQALRSATFRPGSPAEAFAKVVGMLYGDHAQNAFDTLRLQYLTRSSDPAVAAKAAAELLSRETQFARNAREFGFEHGGKDGAQYYYRPAEMLARAYEAFTAHRVDMEGLDTRGISKPDPAYSAEGQKAINEAFARLYPKGDERAHIFEAFQQLHDTLRHNDILAPGHDLAERPPTGDIVDPSKWNRMNQTITPQDKSPWIRVFRQGGVADLKRAALDRAGYDASRPSRPSARSKWMGTKRAVMELVAPISSNMRAIAESQTTEQAKLLVHRLTDLVAPAEGIRSAAEARGRIIGPVFQRAVQNIEHKFINQYADIMKEHGLLNMTPEQKLQMNRFMQTGNKAGIDPNIVAAAGKARFGLDNARRYLENLGHEVGYSKQGFLPHIYDKTRIWDNPDAFEKDARVAYGHAWDENPSIGDGLSRDDFARQAANDWRSRIVQGDPQRFDKMGFSSRFTKGRVIPPAADAVMEKWRINDPNALIPDYFRGVARLGTRTERFGQNDEILAQLFDQMDKAGVHGSDIETLKNFLAGATGQLKAGMPTAMTRAFNTIHAVGTMALMPRALFTSLGEPMAALARTGSPKVAATIFANQVKDIFNTASSQQIRKLADTIGVTTAPLYDSLVSSRMGTTYDDLPGWGKLLTNYFYRTGLTQLTNSQRRSTMAGGHLAMTEWAKDLLSGTAREKTEAAAQFRDLGVADADHATLANWLQAQDGKLPDASLFTGTRPPPEGAALWDHAIQSLVNQIIQNPLASESPLLASSNPVGRLMFGLMRFNYSFYHNIVDQTVGRYEDRFKEAEGFTGKAAAALRMGGGLGMAGAGIFGASLASTMVREAIFNPGKWQEMDSQGQLMDWLTGLAIQRTGLNGPLDPVIQAITALRYEKSLNSLTAGAQLGFFLQAAQDMLQPFTQGSPYSNTADFNAVKGAYNMLAVPAETIGLTALPGGPIAGKLFGAAMMLGTGRGASESVASTIAGPKGSTAPKPGQEGKLPKLSDQLPKLGETKGSQADAGVSGVPLGLLDDFAAPVAKYGGPVVQKLPGPLKVIGGLAGLAAGGSALAEHFSRYTQPPKQQGAP